MKSHSITHRILHMTLLICLQIETHLHGLQISCSISTLSTVLSLIEVKLLLLLSYYHCKYIVKRQLFILTLHALNKSSNSGIYSRQILK